MHAVTDTITLFILSMESDLKMFLLGVGTSAYVNLVILSQVVHLIVGLCPASKIAVAQYFIHLDKGRHGESDV